MPTPEERRTRAQHLLAELRELADDGIAALADGRLEPGSPRGTARGAGVAMDDQPAILFVDPDADWTRFDATSAPPSADMTLAGFLGVIADMKSGWIPPREITAIMHPGEFRVLPVATPTPADVFWRCE